MAADKNKDWTGNKKAVFSTLGSSHHSLKERETHDYYATDPKAGEMLLELESFAKSIWELCCGEGHLSKVFESAGHDVLSSDLIDRGYGYGGKDFLSLDNVSQWNGDIITNPPYKYAKEFIEKSLSLIPDGNKVAMFLRLAFMEGKGRKPLFINFPPKTIYVSSSRINCGKNGNFGLRESGGSAVCFAWFVWEKGFKGNTVLKWFN